MHAMTATEVFLLAILIIFTAPYLVWRLGRTVRGPVDGRGRDSQQLAQRAPHGGRGH